MITNNNYFQNMNSYQMYLNNVNLNFFNIFSINLRSISSLNKFNKFKTFIAKLPKFPDIIAVQETWFEENCCKLYEIPHYNSIHCCRPDGYGGTSIYVSEKYNYKVNCSDNINFMNLIQLRILNCKIKGYPLEFMSFYRSQKCSNESLLQNFRY